jgi:hypothetical protein
LAIKKHLRKKVFLNYFAASGVADVGAAGVVASFGVSTGLLSSIVIFFLSRIKKPRPSS